MPQKCIGKPARVKPPKPTGCPLFPHANGQWAKKIKGRLIYFGPWEDLEGALKRFYENGDPAREAGAATVRDVLNGFMESREALLESGELVRRTYLDYRKSCDLLAKRFSLDRAVATLGPADFDALRRSMARNWGPAKLSREIQQTRTIFKHAYDVGLIPVPVRFGPGFKQASKKIMRQARNAAGSRMLEAGEIRAMIRAADYPLRAMVLLGVNAGYGNADVGMLPKSALDLERGWVSFPRPKTALPRRAPLWAITVDALETALEKRPKSRDSAYDGLAFLTKQGLPWHKEIHANPLAAETRKLLDKLGIRRPGLGFYGLRRAFETIGGETLDQAAVDYVMGHVPHAADMAAVYRQTERPGFDDRLRRVTDHVLNWLWPKA